jgi:hypothetical protein
MCDGGLFVGMWAFWVFAFGEFWGLCVRGRLLFLICWWFVRKYTFITTIYLHFLGIFSIDYTI